MYNNINDYDIKITIIACKITNNEYNNNVDNADNKNNNYHKEGTPQFCDFLNVGVGRTF